MTADVATPERPCDFTVRIPDEFMVEQRNNRFLDRLEDDVSVTMEWCEVWRNEMNYEVVVRGWYGTNKRAAVETLRPLLEAFHAWRLERGR